MWRAAPGGSPPPPFHLWEAFDVGWTPPDLRAKDVRGVARDRKRAANRTRDECSSRTRLCAPRRTPLMRLRRAALCGSPESGPCEPPSRHFTGLDGWLQAECAKRQSGHHASAAAAFSRTRTLGSLLDRVRKPVCSGGQPASATTTTTASASVERFIGGASTAGRFLQRIRTAGSDRCTTHSPRSVASSPFEASGFHGGRPPDRVPILRLDRGRVG